MANYITPNEGSFTDDRFHPISRPREYWVTHSFLLNLRLLTRCDFDMSDHLSHTDSSGLDIVIQGHQKGD
jgi:hypothetical protein